MSITGAEFDHLSASVAVWLASPEADANPDLRRDLERLEFLLSRKGDRTARETAELLELAGRLHGKGELPTKEVPELLRGALHDAYIILLVSEGKGDRIRTGRRTGFPAGPLAGPPRRSAVPSASSSLPQAVDLSVDNNGIGRIRIRGFGSFSPAFVERLFERFKEAEQDVKVKTIVIESADGNFPETDVDFLSGRLAEGRVDDVIRFVRRGLELLDRIEHSEKRVTAVVSGRCFGAGFELALAADNVVVTHRARFAFPEAEWGIIPLFMGGQRLARYGEGISFYLQLAGESRAGILTGRDAYHIGIADFIVEPDDIEDTVLGVSEGFTRPRTKNLQGQWSGIQAALTDNTTRQNLIFGQGVEVNSYHADVLERVRRRPRTLLLLAERMADSKVTKDEFVASLQSLFLTPMAVTGLRTRGRDLAVVDRNREEWIAALFGKVRYGVKVQVNLFGPVILVERTGAAFSERLPRFVLDTLARLRALDEAGQVQDLAAVRLLYPVDFLNPHSPWSEAVIARVTPGGRFEIPDPTGGPSSSGNPNRRTGGSPVKPPIAPTHLGRARSIVSLSALEPLVRSVFATPVIRGGTLPVEGLVAALSGSELKRVRRNGFGGNVRPVSRNTRRQTPVTGAKHRQPPYGALPFFRPPGVMGVLEFMRVL